MLQPGKDEVVLDRTAEVASAIAEQGLQAEGESVPDRLSARDEASFVTGTTSR